MGKIELLYKSGASVFSMDDLRLIWGIEDLDRLKSQASYYFSQGSLIRLARGTYALSQDFNSFELANKLMSPSYVSLHSILQKGGIIFQFQTVVTSCGLNTKSITTNYGKFEYNKIDGKILFNPQGIDTQNNISIATPERALADWIYLNRQPVFDNLQPINKEKLFNIAEIYGKKSVVKRLNKLF